MASLDCNILCFDIFVTLCSFKVDTDVSVEDMFLTQIELYHLSYFRCSDWLHFLQYACIIEKHPRRNVFAFSLHTDTSKTACCSETLESSCITSRCQNPEYCYVMGLRLSETSLSTIRPLSFPWVEK